MNALHRYGGALEFPHLCGLNETSLGPAVGAYGKIYPFNLTEKRSQSPPLLPCQQEAQEVEEVELETVELEVTDSHEVERNDETPEVPWLRRQDIQCPVIVA